MELVLPMYNIHPHFSLKNLDKEVHTIQGKIWYLCLSCFAKIPVQHPERLCIKHVNSNERGGEMSEWTRKEPSWDQFPILQDPQTLADLILPFHLREKCLVFLFKYIF